MYEITLEIIQEDYKKESENCQYDLSPANYNLSSGNQARPQQPFEARISRVMKLTLFSQKK
ncbi:hypothetical protein NQ317_019565 [Molorchus minor]|uniref:Uncharacterized protein n=1 Tax=Molorchus minor TaxID=1323400 RepID=A0ABQ9JZA2_9CUCU|nr:hypothetical protein NQ317_019565 [Molorchus minor]